MTKFMESINTVNTQERKAIIPNVSYTMDSKEDSSVSMVPGQHAVKTEFNLQYYAYAWAPENDGRLIDMARKDILEMFRREVYGDVENGVYKIMESIYRGEGGQESLKKCHDLIQLLKEI